MELHNNLHDRAQIVGWAEQLFRLPNFYVLDTETTGLGKTDEVIQIGIVNRSGDVVMNTLLKPTRPIPYGASRVNGITNDMVRDAPSFMDIYTTLSIHLAGGILIAYNMDFDWRMLAQTARLYGLPMFRAGTLHCAMKQYAIFRGRRDSYARSYRWHKLTAAAAHENIVINGAHTALGDVMMTLELLKVMAAG